MELTIAPLQFGAEQRISIRNQQFDGSIPQRMKKVMGSRWSPEDRCWHIPYSVEAWRCLKQVFSDYELIHAGGLLPDTRSAPDKDFDMTRQAKVPDHSIARMTVSLPQNQTQWLELYLPPELVDACLSTVKNIHGRRWAPERKRWLVPYTQLTLRFLARYFNPDILQWNFKPNVEGIPEGHTPENAPQYRPSSIEPARYEAAVTALEQVLMLKRYSRRTIKSYKNCFRQFIRHYNDLKPSQITRRQINDFLLILVKERGLSISHQSQMMSAIKMFYSSVIAQEDKVKDLFQPKKAQRLPKVLTEEEVVWGGPVLPDTLLRVNFVAMRV
jgi:hypothetical protein